MVKRILPRRYQLIGIVVACALALAVLVAPGGETAFATTGNALCALPVPGGGSQNPTTPQFRFNYSYGYDDSHNYASITNVPVPTFNVWGSNPIPNLLHLYTSDLGQNQILRGSRDTYAQPPGGQPAYDEIYVDYQNEYVPGQHEMFFGIEATGKVDCLSIY